ncbi:uncharacterized protein C1orf167 homolog [Sceloporus undulatus]|uniref:uncharacterized protein C1orf167 homolog n=1 Tax=Sceloporus undulatus TaxID=8520 RepID=UPI001C4C8B92|nr:uncharacterized protein C1orf167 homolog [Sceloporus undulatus]
MESPNQRGQRKENIPPSPLNGYLRPEQRNIQKNVTGNLYLSFGSRVGVSHPHNGSAKPGSNHRRASAKGMPWTTSVGSRTDEPRPVQTNLSCPYWPATTVDSASHKQSNLESKFQRFGFENRAEASNLHPLLPGCISRLDQLGLRRSSTKTLPQQNHEGPPAAHNAISKVRMDTEDHQVAKQPLSHFSNQRSNRNLESHRDALSSSRLLERPSQGSLLHSSCPSSSSSDGSIDFSTQDHLKTSELVEDRPPSATLQAILRSSQRSADLHCSIRRFQEEIEMGALGSFPWDSKYSSLPRQSCSSPPLSITERLTADQNYARQAGERWGASFSRDWGSLGSVAGAFGEDEPFPLTSRYKTAGLHAPAMETLDHAWPTGFSSPTSHSVLGKEVSFSSFQPCLVEQQVLEETVSCSWSKTDHQQQKRGPEEPSSDVSHCCELGQKDLPLGLLSTGGLEVSSDTSHVNFPRNMGVSIYDTQRDWTSWSPGGPEVVPVHQFGNGSKDLDSHEPGESGGTPSVVNSVDEGSSFLPQWKLNVFGANAKKDLEEHSQTSDGTQVVDAKTLAVGSSRGPSDSFGGSGWPNMGSGQREESFVEKAKERMELPSGNWRDFAIDATRRKDLERDNRSTEKKRNRPLPLRRDPLLAKSFVAWRDHVFERKATARALYERQLKRKGLAALQWAVQLRNAQVGIAQRNHTLAVLTASFRRWQDVTAKQQEARTSRHMEPERCGQGLLRSALGRPLLVTRHPILSQLSSEHQEEATRYSRAEGSLWMQLRHVQGTDELCRKADALRDVRRLAAAFRLWRLQKERMEREDAYAQEVRVILEKKKLANVFQTWRSRYRASKQTWPLAARIRRGLIRQCFDAWRRFARREAFSRLGLEGLRIQSLRRCFQHWARMVEVKERARRALLGLLASKQRKSYASRLGFGRDACMAQPCLDVTRWSQRNGGDSLDDLLHAVTLQGAFQTWRKRWHESQLATVFSRASAQRQMRKVLGWWWWRTLSPNPLGVQPSRYAEDPLLASPNSEESSLSSGFHSGGPALSTPSGSLQKESSLENSSSRTSVSSWAAAEDVGLLPCHDSSLPEDLINVALELPPRTPPALYSYHVGENHFQGKRFPNPGGNDESKPILARSVQKGAQPDDHAAEVQHRRRVLARYFGLWSASTHRNQKASQHQRHVLLSRAFHHWVTAASHSSAQREALARFEGARQQRLLEAYFGKWKTEFVRASQQRWSEESPPGRPEMGYRVLRRWRKATRGYRALRLSSVNQAGNYWTRAAAFRQCRRQRSSLIGPQKFTKLFPICPGRHRKKDVRIQPSLTFSSFHVSLVTYRSQSRTLWVKVPPEGLDVKGQRSGCTWIQESDTEADSAAEERQWLGRKYLSVWRHNVLLRRFQDARDSRRLVKSWMLWKDACRTNLLGKALARQRLAEWSWKTWRWRFLQSWIAEHFLANDNRRLLQKAFGRWKQLAAATRMENKISF